MGIPQPPVTPQGWDRRRDRARDYASGHEVDSQQISLGLPSPRLLSRRQTTIRDRRRASPSPTPPKLQLYVPSEPTARALHRLLINAVDERVRLPPWSQATQGLRGTSPRTTRLQLQYLARRPSRLDPTNDKNFSSHCVETCRVRRRRGPVPLRDHGAAPTSPPGGVLRQLGLPLRRVWALTSSELPRAVSDGPI